MARRDAFAPQEAVASGRSTRSARRLGDTEIGDAVMLENLPENELTDRIIGLAIEVHKEYGGPGLKESAYEAALEWELKRNGLKVIRQRPVPVVYKGHVFEIGDENPKKLDLLVEDKVIVECKAVSKTARDEVFRAQCRTYLKMLGLRVGLVINFGRPTLKEGIDRVVNETREERRRRLAAEDAAALRNVLREEDAVPEECLPHVEQQYGETAIRGDRKDSR